MKTMGRGALLAVVLGAALLVFPAAGGSDAAQGPSLAGAWLGTLKVSPATSLRVGFFVQVNPDGSLAGMFASLDQGAAVPLVLSRITQTRGRATITVTMEVGAGGGRYQGTLNADGSQIDGQWMQGGASQALTLRRVQPQEPQRPYPYPEEEVTYQNTKDAATLAGTLTLPPAGGPFPAVILITGSGQEDRDETIYGHRLFLVLADHLTRRGTAVLRVDDRGVGGSMGDYLHATSETFAHDVLAGVEYLKTRPEIDHKRIGLIGHSEGGIIAPLAAVDSNDVAFVILMAGPGVRGDLIIEQQIAYLLTADGAPQAAIDAALQGQRAVVNVVQTEMDPNRVRAKLLSLGCTETQIQSATSPWFHFFVTHEPQETLRQVRCPVLALNGALDTQVFAQANLPAIAQALREGGNPDFAVQEMPRLNHLFQTAQTGKVGEYAFLEETMSPVVLEAVAAWIKARMKTK